MKTPFRPRRDFLGMEQRRKRAARLFKQGKTQAEVARELRVSRQSVSRWRKQYQHGGVTALRGAGRAGRKPKLTPAQLNRVDSALRRGAQAHGFGTDLWTLPRVAHVIGKLTGVQYHSGHVWRVLKSLNWSLQRPSKQAKERNEIAVRQWVAERWPAVKKTPADGAPGSSSKTRAASPNDPPSAAPGRPREKPRS